MQWPSQASTKPFTIIPYSSLALKRQLDLLNTSSIYGRKLLTILRMLTEWCICAEDSGFKVAPWESWQSQFLNWFVSITLNVLHSTNLYLDLLNSFPVLPLFFYRDRLEFQSILHSFATLQGMRTIWESTIYTERLQKVVYKNTECTHTVPNL